MLLELLEKPPLIMLLPLFGENLLTKTSKNHIKIDFGVSETFLSLVLLLESFLLNPTLLLNSLRVILYILGHNCKINQSNIHKKLLNLSHLIEESISYQVEDVNLLSPLPHPKNKINFKFSSEKYF